MKLKPFEVFESKSSGKKGLYVIENNDLYIVNDDIIMLLEQDGRDKTEIYKNLSNKLEADIIDDMISEMERLDILESKTFLKEEVPSKVFEICKTLTLMIEQDCNMKCSYCFAGDGEYNNKGKMKFPTARLAINFLVENSYDIENLSIVLFGGEPLLDFKLFSSIIEYCKSIEHDVNKKFQFSTTTNGTLINPKVEKFLIDNQIRTMISIDGDKDEHNRNRYFQNNVESYDVILKKTKKLREKELLSARATLSKGNLNTVNVFEHLYGLNFRPVAIFPAFNTFDDRDFTSYSKSLKEAVDHFEFLVKSGDTTKAKNFSLVYSLMSKLHSSNQEVYNCSVGIGGLSVDINGRLFPCHRFTSDIDFKIGSIYSGFKGRKEFIKKTLVTERDDCKGCFARNLCAGGCYNEFVTNDEKADKICEVYKSFIKNIIVSYMNLSSEEKEIIFN